VPGAVGFAVAAGAGVVLPAAGVVLPAAGDVLAGLGVDALEPVLVALLPPPHPARPHAATTAASAARAVARPSRLTFLAAITAPFRSEAPRTLAPHAVYNLKGP